MNHELSRYRLPRKPRGTEFHFICNPDILLVTHSLLGARWRSWLRHCATSREVAGSIGIFTRIIIPAVESTHPLTDMRTKVTFWRVKAADAYG